MILLGRGERMEATAAVIMISMMYGVFSEKNEKETLKKPPFF
jgi:hypothetical protein